MLGIWSEVVVLGGRGGGFRGCNEVPVGWWTIKVWGIDAGGDELHAGDEA